MLNTANFNQLKDYGYHILMLAVENNCIGIVLLIANNADINYANLIGDTLLILV